MAYSRLRCQKCIEDGNDVSFGQEARFLDHLTDVHGISDHLKFYLEIHHGHQHPTCQCSPECNVKLLWAGWKKGFTSKYARGHNARVDSVYLNKDRQKQFIEKRLEGFKSGRNKAWNSGLTKESDDRIKASAEKISASLNSGYQSGLIIDWHVKDPIKAKKAAEKQSMTMTKMYATGEIKPWNFGQTKLTNTIIAAAAEKITARYKRPNAGARIKVDELKQRIDKYADRFLLVSNVDDYVTRRIARLDFRCTTCGLTQSKSLAMLEESPICFKCHPKDSKGQLEIYEFIKSLGVTDVELSNRVILNGRELDVYVPSAKFALEYHGLYWHSSARQGDPKHDQQKHVDCQALGINLLSVFEDEWRDKRKIVEGMIMYRLGKSRFSIGARECSIREISSIERREFFDANHLDGDARAKTAWGLFYAGELVSALSIRKPFHKLYDDSIEVARFASLFGVSCPGALSRLSKKALDHARETGTKRLITYADARVGSTKGYPNAGWTFVKNTAQRFWWTDFVHRFDRFKYKADKARNMSQQQVADEAGVVQIFGCTNSLWMCSV